MHVTLRTLDHVWNLRSRRSFQVIEAALAGVRSYRDFRVVHFSVQGNHLHLLVEADDNRALSEGLQGLSVRLAKGLNRMMELIRFRGVSSQRSAALGNRHHGLSPTLRERETRATSCP